MPFLRRASGTKGECPLAPQSTGRNRADNGQNSRHRSWLRRMAADPDHRIDPHPAYRWERQVDFRIHVWPPSARDGSVGCAAAASALILGEIAGDTTMMSAQENDLITRVAPGTPCGNLMRRYWQPAALVEELAERRPVKPVRLLGEDLVLFRDEQGRYGLLHRQCPPRGAALALGRR